jgi:hypothetical protein
MAGRKNRSGIPKRRLIIQTAYNPKPRQFRVWHAYFLKRNFLESSRGCFHQPSIKPQTATKLGKGFALDIPAGNGGQKPEGATSLFCEQNQTRPWFRQSRGCYNFVCPRNLPWVAVSF